MSAGTFRPDIEGLRAIAVTMVLIYHADTAFLPGGYIGVDIFFVISGYLITRSLIREASTTHRVALATFYARRARRLLPAAAGVLLTTALSVRLLLPATMWRDFGGDITAAAAYFINWRLAWRSVDYLAEDVVVSPVQHFWSLAVEEQFYVVWPLLIVAATWFALRRRWRIEPTLLWTVALVVVVPSLVYSIVLTSGDQARAFFDTGTRLWELGIGAIGAGIAPRFVRVPPAVRTVIRVVALIVLGVVAVRVSAASPWPGWIAAGATLPTLALIMMGERGADDPHRDIVDRALASPFMQRIGAWSYSLYLWHWPPLAIFAARWGGLTTTQGVVIVLASFVPAYLSYRFVEDPFRRATSVRASTRFTLSVGANLTLAGSIAGLAVVLAIPAVSAADGGDIVGAAAAVRLTDDAAAIASLDNVDAVVPVPTAAVDDLPQLYADDCQVNQAATKPVVCAYGDPDGPIEIALVGDSKAGQWLSALDEAGRERGWRVPSVTKSACELTTTMPERAGEPYEACLEWSAAVLELLRQDPPDLVLVSQGSSIGYTEAPGEDPQAVLVEGMVDAYRQLEAAGSTVAVLMDNPAPHGNVYECVALHPDDLAQCTFDRSNERSGRAPQREAAEVGRFPIIDMTDITCPTQTCLPVIGDVLVYRQGSHLTDTFVRTAGPFLAERVEEVLNGSS